MSNDNFNINLIKVNECLGINFYSGSIRLEDLFTNFDVPIYKTGKTITSDDGGYQREAKPDRVDKISHRIIDPSPGQNLPNTEAFVDNININLRSEAAEKSYVKPIDKNRTGFGELYIFSYVNSLGKFRIVDGQTRVKGAYSAYRNAIDSKEFELAEQIKNLRLQITITFTENKFKEAYVFYLINQYAKAIPTEGAIRLLYEGMKEESIDFVNEVSRSQKDDEVETMSVVQRLSDNSDIWSGHIADFNETNRKNKIPINTFTRISKSFYKKVSNSVKEAGNNESNRAENLTFDIMEAYWCGIRDAYPKMFQINNVDKYNILKSGTAEVLIKVLEQLFTFTIRGTIQIGDLQDSKTYETLMKKTLDNYKGTNGYDKTVSGIDLFLVGQSGVFGSYGNGKLKDNAKEKIIATMLNNL